MELLTLDKFPRKVLAGIDIQRAFIVSRLIVAAERLHVFRALHGKRMTAESIGRALKIHPAYRDAFLNALVSLGLLHKAEQVLPQGAVDLLDTTILKGMRAGLRGADSIGDVARVRTQLRIA